MSANGRRPAPTSAATSARALFTASFSFTPYQCPELGFPNRPCVLPRVRRTREKIGRENTVEGDASQLRLDSGKIAEVCPLLVDERSLREWRIVNLNVRQHSSLNLGVQRCGGLE